MDPRTYLFVPGNRRERFAKALVSGADAVVIAKNGFREPTVWRGGDSIEPRHGTVRIHVRFEGIRPEDARLHAVYVAG